jgi:hypothetical protein
MKYYKHIDELPLYNWIKINDGDLKYCRKDISKGTKKEDLEQYEIITDSNYEAFGLDKSHARLLDLYYQLSMERLEWISTGNNFIKNKIKRLEYEIDDLFKRMDEGGESNIGETIILMGKWVGYRIDDKITTVKEFRSMISLFKKEMQEKIK